MGPEGREVALSGPSVQEPTLGGSLPWFPRPEPAGPGGQCDSGGVVHRCWKTATSGGNFAIAVARQAMSPTTSWTRRGWRTWVSLQSR